MITPQLVNLTEKEEEFRGRPYRDTNGKWTFGFGFNLDDNELTREEGEYLMMSRLAIAEHDARKLFSNFDELDVVRQNIVTAMLYQMGLPSVAGFTEFRKAVAAKDWKMARFHGLDSLWAREDSPARAARLMLMMETGEYLEKT